MPLERHYALLLGANDPNRYENIVCASVRLTQLGTVECLSHIYETEPWGIRSRLWFLNRCVILKSGLSPYELLLAIKRLEKEIGRNDHTPPAHGRPIDIDILLTNDQLICSSEPILPHPRMHLRRFVLVPLAEIASHWRHPLLKATVSELLARCPDTLQVRKYEPQPAPTHSY